MVKKNDILFHFWSMLMTVIEKFVRSEKALWTAHSTYK
ncbi:hypothetical protein HSIEG1_899 [Enterococcus sp. HSIEG1]|nr:hypothetical protein HSIEG1_899 [Enterococcus sp. HSIEG1]